MNKSLWLVMLVLAMGVSACSKSEEEKKELTNHSNTGKMGEQLQGNPMQGYGQALDKAHNVGDTLQKDAQQLKTEPGQ